MKRLRKVAAFAICASFLATLASTHPAFANAGANCISNPTNPVGHCFSIQYGETTTSTAFKDLIGSIPSDKLEYNASPGTGEFITGEMWTSNYTTGAWIETGFTKTYPNSYEVYWADNKPNCTGINCYFEHPILYYGSDPTPANHTFQIVRNATLGHWDIFFDGVYKGVSTVTGMYSSTDASWGSEIAANNSDHFYSCFGHCYNTGLGSGVWAMTALPYNGGSPYSWSTLGTPRITPSSDYHGGADTTYPWVWYWYKQLQ